jgi:hypothetical protein
MLPVEKSTMNQIHPALRRVYFSTIEVDFLTMCCGSFLWLLACLWMKNAHSNCETLVFARR